MANARQLDKKKWILQSYKNGIRKTFRGSSRAEVEKAERDWLNDLEMYGAELRKTTSTLEVLMYENLFTNIKIKVGETGFERYMSSYNTYFKENKFCQKNITSYSQKQLQDFLNTLQNKSDTTIKMAHILLKKTFQYAIDNNFIRINPMDKVSKPKSTLEKKKVEAMSLQEQKIYMDACKKHKHGDLFTIALLTGMRQGELIALRWDCIDFDNMLLHVKHTSKIIRMYDNNGNYKNMNLITSPKTSSSKRTIPIDKTLKNILNKLYLKSPTKEFVFCNTTGEQLKNSTIQKAHNKLLKDLGLPHFPFHALRHTFATRQVELGVDIRTLSELLGHADVSITLNRYCHSTLDSKKDAIEKMGKLISTL